MELALIRLRTHFPELNSMTKTNFPGFSKLDFNKLKFHDLPGFP